MVSDTSVLIGLAAAGRLDLLHKLWKVVFIPEEVFREVKPRRLGHAEVQAAVAAGWLRVECAGGQLLTKGEDGCIALARKLGAHLVLADDEKARKRIAAAGFVVSGAVGVLVMALRRGLMRPSEVPAVLESWRRSRFWLSERLVEILLEESRAPGS